MAAVARKNELVGLTYTLSSLDSSILIVVVSTTNSGKGFHGLTTRTEKKTVF